jgi:hypothetical protein
MSSIPSDAATAHAAILANAMMARLAERESDG